jgi:hypothetical protein
MKECNYCHVEKELNEFPLKKDGTRSGNCLVCKEKRKNYNATNKEAITRKKQVYYEKNKDDILEDRKEYYEENKDIILARNKAKYEENKVEYLEYKKEYYLEHQEHYSQLSKKDRRENPAKYLLKNAKKRAKDKNLPIDITIEDIIIPDVCPVLGIPLVIGNTLEERDSSPSLDRIIPELGYVKGNIRVISFKANSLKKDGSIEDFEKIIRYIKESHETETK